MNRMRMRLLMRKNRHTTPQVSLTPLIDTALTLLVVFMVTAPIAHRSIAVDLPQGVSASPDSLQQSELIITITQREEIYVDTTPIPRDRYPVILTELIASLSQPVQIFLRVDKKASSGIAIELLSFLRSVEGVSCVAFDIDHHEPSQAQLKL